VKNHAAKINDADWDEQLTASKSHYFFNLAWLKQLPPAPKK